MSAGSSLSYPHVYSHNEKMQLILLYSNGIYGNFGLILGPSSSTLSAPTLTNHPPRTRCMTCSS